MGPRGLGTPCHPNSGTKWTKWHGVAQRQKPKVATKQKWDSYTSCTTLRKGMGRQKMDSGCHSDVHKDVAIGIGSSHRQMYRVTWGA